MRGKTNDSFIIRNQSKPDQVGTRIKYVSIAIKRAEFGRITNSVGQIKINQKLI